ncbi:MAG: c-type cytochrome biogenesis protein CcmI, partial [Pseudorhodoplanes sp.]
MTLWFVLAMMTAAAIFVVLWPLARKPAAATQDSAINVYRDQLAEIARDRDSGRLPAEEAEAARVEVARRLLTAAERAEQPARVAIGLRRVTALAALILFPVGATILYLSLGAPWVPSEPLSARSAPRPEQRSLESLVAQVEARLAAVPDDGRGWEVLAPVYMQLGRFDDAVKARRNALRLLGVTAQREADLGEALTGAANGIVTAEAKAAFARALAIDADEASANYYVGLAAEQDGKPEEAAAIWRKLLARTPAEVPWLPLVRKKLARDEAAAPPTTGPTPDDVAAAA